MKPGLQIAGAIGLGYLLGRTHKTRLALAIGIAAASGQFSRPSGGLMELGTKALTSSGLGKQLTGQLSGPGQKLVEAGKAAALVALSSRIESLTDTLHDRAEAMSNPQPSAEAEDDEGAEEQPEKPAKAKPKGKAPKGKSEEQPEEPEQQPEEPEEDEEPEGSAENEEPEEEEEEDEEEPAEPRDSTEDETEEGSDEDETAEPAMAGKSAAKTTTSRPKAEGSPVRRTKR